MSGLGLTELIILLVNFVIVLVPLGAVLVVIVYFFQRLRKIEDKLDRLLEPKAVSSEDQL